MLLTKEAILAAQDVRFEIGKVPEWGGEVRVSSMTGAARDDYEQTLIAGRGANEGANLKNMRALMVAASVVDDAGALLFGKEDVEALGKKSAGALNRVYSAAARLNAIGDSEVAELVKPSAPAPGADSGSGLPAS